MTEPDGTTVDEAAEAVVASRRALTAATRAEHGYQIAQEAHRIALERLRAAIQAAATPGVDHEHAEDAASFRLSNRLRVRASSLDAWIAQQEQAEADRIARIAG